jgi:diacylglycerol kinase family enzyme
VGDGETYVRETCEATAEGTIRFYSCGGDGTLGETVNGAYGCPRAEVACIPAGTGNDFIRMFGARESFLDVGATIAGAPVDVDVIEYGIIGELSSRSPTGALPRPGGYAINMFNMGFDANVVTRTQRLKRRPFLGGTGAYVAGVAAELAKMKGLDVSVAYDDGEPQRARLLLVGIGNGRYSGGGFNGIPMAETDDGYIDVMAVNMMSRSTFLKFVKDYHDGTHMQRKEIAEILTHTRCRAVELETKEEVDLAVDGETCGVRGKIRFFVADKKIRFVLPKGIEL